LRVSGCFWGCWGLSWMCMCMCRTYEVPCVAGPVHGLNAQKIPCGALCEARRGSPDHPPSQKRETRSAKQGREENNGHNGNCDLVGNACTFPRSVGVLALCWACAEIKESILWPSYVPKSPSCNPQPHLHPWQHVATNPSSTVAPMRT
jgi:hypothetical protein